MHNMWQRIQAKVEDTDHLQRGMQTGARAPDLKRVHEEEGKYKTVTGL